ncbi:MAG: hypothetical protein OEY97_13060 [Nitrospirota bacterium]|nr:hypothetical protein [Nitrospirota bacterium]
MSVAVPLSAAIPLAAGVALAGSIQIESPRDGETVGSDVEVRVKLVRGEGVDHYHLFVDGMFRQAVMNRKSILSDLPPGKHRIKVWATGDGHRLLAPNHEIVVTVR